MPHSLKASRQNHGKGSPNLVTAFGETRTLRDWLFHPKCTVGKVSILRARMGSGWSPEDAISRPLRERADAAKVTAFGLTRSLTVWARDPRCSVTRSTIAYRLRIGWPPEDAITAPQHQRPDLLRITAFGEEHTIIEWANDRRCTVSLGVLRSRLSRPGWTPERAISQPARPGPGSALITIDGETKELHEWIKSDRCTVTKTTVRRRLDEGMEPKAAITVPSTRARRTSRNL